MAKHNLIKASRDAIRSNPKEIFNWYLLACTCIWSFSGVAKGFDEGMSFSPLVIAVFYQSF
jgi:hypothetical protein